MIAQATRGRDMLAKTTTTLLEGLLEGPEDQAWREFDERYRPIIVAFARRIGVGETDAADAAQDTLTEFVKAYRAGQYDRARGTLRSWLIGIAKHCINDQRARRAKQREVRGISAIVEWPDDHGLTRIWDAECQHSIVHHGLRQLKNETKMDERTIQAFELLTVEQRTTDDVARIMNISKNDVYLAKHRCLSRLRSILAGLSQAYEIA